MLDDADSTRQSGPDCFDDDDAPPVRAVPIPAMSGAEMLRIWYSGTGKISEEELSHFGIVPPGFVNERGGADLIDMPPLDEPDHELPTSQGQSFDLVPPVMPAVAKPSACGVKAVADAPAGMLMMVCSRVSNRSQLGSLLDQQIRTACGVAGRGHELVGSWAIVASGREDGIWLDMITHTKQVAHRRGFPVGVVFSDPTRIGRGEAVPAPPTADELKRMIEQFEGLSVFTMTDPDATQSEVDRLDRGRRDEVLDRPSAAREMLSTGTAVRVIAEVLDASERSVRRWVNSGVE